jgi:hypothetical protein
MFENFFKPDPNPIGVDTSLPEHIDVAFAAWWWDASMSAMATPERSLLASRCEVSANEGALGEVKDWVWTDVTNLSCDERLDRAERYAGILMAQFPPLADRLSQLSESLRRWALPIASVQPLPRVIDWALSPELQSYAMGYAELGLWIHRDFPNLWQRLLGDLHPDVRQPVAQLVAAHHDRLDHLNPALRRRVLRCWAMTE